MLQKEVLTITVSKSFTNIRAPVQHEDKGWSSFLHSFFNGVSRFPPVTGFTAPKECSIEILPEYVIVMYGDTTIITD